MPKPQVKPQQSGKTSAALPKNWPREITYLTTLHIPPPLTISILQVSTLDGGTSTSLESRSNDRIKSPKPEGSVASAPNSASASASLPIIKPQYLGLPNPLVRITPITSSTHPAHGQYGLFATRPLPPSSFIILYLGTLHKSAGSTEVEKSSTSSPSTPTSDSAYATSDYDLSLDRELGLAIDASNCGNEARFINDYRGIRPAGPNAEFRDCLVPTGSGPGKLERRIGVFVLSPGKAGGPRAKGIGKGEEIVVSYGKGFWNARKDG